MKKELILSSAPFPALNSEWKSILYSLRHCQWIFYFTSKASGLFQKSPLLTEIKKALSLSKNLTPGCRFSQDKLQKRAVKINILFQDKRLFTRSFFTLWTFICCVCCVFPSPFPSPSEIHQASQADEEEQGSSRGRGFVSSRERPSVSDKPCRESNECPDICEKIFIHRTERDECEDHSVSEVREFERIYDFLINSSDGDPSQYSGNLRRIQDEVLEDFVRISEGLPRFLFGKIPSSVRQTFINWLAEISDITAIFKDEDESFDVLKGIFGSNPENDLSVSALASVLNQPGRIEGAEKAPIKVAVREGNRDFLQWIHDYFVEQDDCDTSSELLENCYCSLTLDANEQRDYLEFRPLKDLLEQETPEFSPSSWKDGC